MVQCLLGRGLVEPGTLADGLAGDFQLTPAGQNLSNEYQWVLNQMSPAEQAAIAQRLSSTGEFRYTAANAMADAARDVQMGTRLDGLGQSVMGTLGSWASSILCPTTGIACAGVAEGADNFNAGLTSFYTGRPTLTLQNQAWQAAGLTPGQANTAEALVGLGIAGGSAASINRQIEGVTKVAPPANQANGAGRTETPNNLLPDNIRGDGLAVPYEISDARATKIFGTREGHVQDTPANRDLIHSVANDEAAMLGTDRHGTQWFAQSQPDGSQVWVQVRNGQVWNAGVNKNPKSWDPNTGLAAPTKPRQN